MVVWLCVRDCIIVLVWLIVCKWLLFVLVLLFNIIGVLFGSLNILEICLVVLLFIIWDNVLCNVFVILIGKICMFWVLIGVNLVLNGVFCVKCRWLICFVGICILLFKIIFINLDKVVGLLFELFSVVVREGIRWLNG